MPARKGAWADFHLDPPGLVRYIKIRFFAFLTAFLPRSVYPPYRQRVIRTSPGPTASRVLPRFFMSKKKYTYFMSEKEYFFIYHSVSGYQEIFSPRFRGLVHISITGWFAAPNNRISESGCSRQYGHHGQIRTNTGIPFGRKNPPSPAETAGLRYPPAFTPPPWPSPTSGEGK